MKKLIILLILSLLLFSQIIGAFTLNYSITGITNNDALQNALNRLKVVAENNGAPLSLDDINNFQATATDNIQKALQPYGYFKSQVTAQIKQSGANYYANYQVIPGPQMHITQVNLTITGDGANNSIILHYVNHFPLQKGQILNTEKYLDAKHALFNTALQQGYIAAYFEQQQILIDTNNYTAIINLQLATGPRYYFGPVIYNKNPFDTSFLNRYAPFQQGQPYSTDQLINFQNALSNSNYFQQISINGQTDKANNYQIPVTVNLIPKLANLYTLGVGYGTDTGPRATLGWDWRRASSTGNYLATQIYVSQVQNSLQAKYVIPGDNPLTDQYNITAGALTTNINQGNSRTYQVGVNQIKTFNNWQQTISLNYQFERYQFTDQPYQNSALLLPGISWLNITKNDPVYPTQGNRFSLSIQGSTEALFSTTSFIQGEMQDKYIFSPTDDSRVILRTDLGYTAVHDFNTLPLSLRFYAGGSQSVRGYEYQALGLPDGGRYLVVGSAEYQHQIIGNWNAAIFYDAGNAFDNFNQGLDRGAGIGIVYKTPIGPFELTLGKAYDLPGNPMKLQFSMGPDL